ncbi:MULTISPECIES: hypothetical protein [unclassified Streptomyces]|uniref:hypothetical protein n=1 Tax=unclassified Streptomyces TaxID=2593676 RepID=UPI0033245628
MKRMTRWTTGLLAVGGFAVALLAAPAASAQANELTVQCSGGCAQSVPDGFQVSSTTGDFTTNGNWDPH